MKLPVEANLNYDTESIQMSSFRSEIFRDFEEHLEPEFTKPVTPPFKGSVFKGYEDPKQF